MAMLRPWHSVDQLRCHMQPVAPHRLGELMYKYSYIVSIATDPIEDPVQSTRRVEVLQDAVERDNIPSRAAKRRAIDRIRIADDADFFYGTGEGRHNISIATTNVADPPESVRSSIRDVIDLTGMSTNTYSYGHQYENDFAPEEVASTVDSTGSNRQKSPVRNEHEYENISEVAHGQEHLNNANTSRKFDPARLRIVHPDQDNDDIKATCHGVGFGQQFPSCSDLTAPPDVIEQLCQVSLDPCSDDFSFVSSTTQVVELQDAQLFGPDLFSLARYMVVFGAATWCAEDAAQDGGRY